jgi:uncharacterized protein YbjT (DUF2867 family)
MKDLRFAEVMQVLRTRKQTQSALDYARMEAARMMHQRTKVGGGCLCGAVRYEAEARRHGEVLRASVLGLSVSGYLRDTPDRIAAWRQDVEDALRWVGVPE